MCNVQHSSRGRILASASPVTRRLQPCHGASGPPQHKPSSFAAFELRPCRPSDSGFLALLPASCAGLGAALADLVLLFVLTAFVLAILAVLRRDLRVSRKQL